MANAIISNRLFVVKREIRRLKKVIDNMKEEGVPDSDIKIYYDRLKEYRVERESLKRWNKLF